MRIVRRPKEEQLLVTSVWVHRVRGEVAVASIAVEKSLLET
jgi:hypothetical protein